MLAYANFSKVIYTICGPGLESIVSVALHADKMCIALPRFFFTDDKVIPPFEIPNVSYVLHDNGEIDFAYKNQHINVSDESGNQKEITIYDIKGTIIEGKLDMAVNFKYGKMPFRLTVHYISK